MKENWQACDTGEVGMRLDETLRLPVMLTQQGVEPCLSQLMLVQLDNSCT